MESFNKLIKKQQQKDKKNPGKANKEKQKEKNRLKRGEPIPVSKVVTPKNIKEKKRNRLKSKLKSEINNFQ